MRRFTLLLATVCLSSLACETAVPPHFDMATGMAAFNVSDSCTEAAKLGGVATGDALVVVHQIAPQIENPPEGLVITIETVCAQIELEPTYDDEGRAVALFSAPAGAECGIVAIAEVANSTIRCEVVDDAPCNYECPELSAESTETGTTGTTDGTTG